ncbi:MAG TPA: DUF1553 domain-containing protein [Pirellulales bacterium]|nr:DUF1553 domain-containing protein [Pirellulales bacterium]
MDRIAIAFSIRTAVFISALIVGIAGWSVARADDAATVAPSPTPTAKRVDFDRQVAPILLRRCAGCHNPGENSGGLSLLSLESARVGGKSGEPAIKPGDIDNSYAITRIEAGEMPPPQKAKPVEPAELVLLKRWIDSGAAWTKGRVLDPLSTTTDTRAGRDWWSLQAPVRPKLPQVKNAHWIRTPIDAFVLAKLEENGLEPSPEADRATLIRRATLDVLGLPPSPEEVQAFVADRSPDAYERLVDRLFASPHYGECWARHWLDVVRFAESDGFEMNRPRPNAWPFRDYVIESFNSDKPYTQFITEQLAGEQIGADVATGYLVAGPWDQVKSPDVELTRLQRLAELDDMVSTTTTAFLGLTSGCAKCHDHKFDPITQRDYYAMQAIFAGVQHGERALPESPEQGRRRRAIEQEIAAAEQKKRAIAVSIEPLARVRSRSGDSPHSSNKKSARLRAAVNPLYNVDRFEAVMAKYVRFTVRATNNLEPCIDELEIYSAGPPPRNVALASAGGAASASGTFANGTYKLHQLPHINDGHYGNSWSWISNEVGRGWVQIELREPTRIDRIVWARDREGVFRDRLATSYRIEVAIEPGKWQTVATSDDRQPYDPRATPIPLDPSQLPSGQKLKYESLEASIALASARLKQSQPPVAYAGNFSQPGEPTYRLNRGDPMQRKEEVQPGSIAAVGKAFELSSAAPEAQRRLALARWIADPSNPLTARVMVNRIWMYHFGQGLERSPSDFGFNGGKPSHPKLLDWLATEFMANGWRPKYIHRLILLSSTYRQSSRFDARNAAIDGDDTFLWRFRSRRLDAEPIRDSILSVSGTLETRMGGPGFDVFEPNNNYVKVYFPKQTFGPAEWRRMIYLDKPRMQFDATFGAFDCPDSAQPLAKRNTSTTALQALNLLNGSFVEQQTARFARRLNRDRPNDVPGQIQRAFWLAFGRAPDGEELRAAEKLVAHEGLPIFCRAMLNANELVYLP